MLCYSQGQIIFHQIKFDNLFLFPNLATNVDSKHSLLFEQWTGFTYLAVLLLSHISILVFIGSLPNVYNNTSIFNKFKLSYDYWLSLKYLLIISLHNISLFVHTHIYLYMQSEKYYIKYIVFLSFYLLFVITFFWTNTGYKLVTPFTI